jgi:hypothetical protein
LDINDLTVRQLQTESARALSILGSSSGAISTFNDNARHDSQKWYKEVISTYVEIYGDLPSKVGPASEITLIMDSNV